MVGGIALLVSGGTAAVAGTRRLLSSSTDAGAGDAVQTAAVTGLQGIDLDVDAGNMRVEFGDVDEARLSITNSRGPAWTLERDGDDTGRALAELRVRMVVRQLVR